MIKFSVYDEFSGRCKICGEDTLWGDAPHNEGCEFAEALLGHKCKQTKDEIIRTAVFNILDKMRTPIITKNKI
jgi:hypothetical protein